MLIIIAGYIADFILVTGEKGAVCKFLVGFDNKLKVGTIEYGTSNIRFYGMKIVQNEDSTCQINSDDKLKAL